MKKLSVNLNQVPISLNILDGVSSTSQTSLVMNIQLVKSSNVVPSTRVKAWDDMNIISKHQNMATDPREYPKSHDKYDLAELKSWKVVVKNIKDKDSKCSLPLNLGKSPSKRKETYFKKDNISSIKTHNRLASSEKSASKYDVPYVGIIDNSAIKARISRYDDNKILPDFVYNFMTGDNTGKVDAFIKHPEQFPSTSFSDVGGIFLMPNPKYVMGEKEYFDHPNTVIASTKTTGGISLVGYWVPPKLFEGTEIFNKLFSSEHAIQAPQRERETISDYNKRSAHAFITNPIDLKKAHIPMLEEFKIMALKNLKDVYGVDELKDKVDMYVHSPVYGDKTAGLHIHVRVNQLLPAGEQDANSTKLATLINTLNRDNISDNEMMAALLNKSLKTNNKYYSFSAAWDKQAGVPDEKGNIEGEQFKGIPVKFVPNPWKRPL